MRRSKRRFLASKGIGSTRQRVQRQSTYRFVFVEGPPDPAFLEAYERQRRDLQRDQDWRDLFGFGWVD